jgi:aspartyl-tRNA(Asn)/glutamyl-tRNA(Gln) amidotransferase subunit A
MGGGEQADLAALLRARLAAAGLEPPPGDTSNLERDLALHLERIAALAAASDLGPDDPPRTDPTTAARPGARVGEVGQAGSGGAVGSGGVDKRGTSAPGSVTLPSGGPAAGARGEGRGETRAGTGAGTRAGTGAGTRAGTGAETGTEALAAGSGARWGAGAEPWSGGLVEQARMVREGNVSSVELVERALERIAGMDGQLGAFVLVLGDQALAEAAERDAERRRGKVVGVLHGVPVAVKDLIDLEGVVTGAGSVKLEGNRAGRDAEVVGRLRGAGAVVVGKTRTHEFAYGVTTPGTVNPWEPERIAGGSSGGSAAAVAAGLVAGALGSDTAGSIRIPSSCCGVVGLKPTWGRVPATGVWPLSWSCDHVGPIAATVADVALLDQVLAAEPSGPGGDAGPVRPRIGRLVGGDLDPVDPAVTAVVDELCRRLEAAGAVVDEVTLPLQAARGAVAAIVLAEAAAAHDRLLGETGEDGYSRAMLAMIRIGRSALAGEYLAGLRYRGRFVAEVEGLLAGRDALLLPTLPCPAPLAGERTVTIAGTRVGVQAALTRLPGPFNCSGSPVLSLPAGLVENLPVGVSLVGRIGGDRDLLALGAWAEAVAPEIGRPAIHA